MSESISADPVGSRGEPAFPALQMSFDKCSGRQQTTFLRLTRGSLVATVAAAAGGAISLGDAPDWAALLALVGFALALVCRAALMIKQPERAWYEARAGAESVKTLAWQFAVGGALFPIRDGTEDSAREQILSRLKELLQVQSEMGAPPPAGGQQITSWMTTTRGLSLPARCDLYRAKRLSDQITWYTTKSNDNSRRASQWSWAVIAFQAAGALAAALRVAGEIDFDLLGIAAAAAAAGAAWLEVKDHSNLAEAYATTAHELTLVRDALPASCDEQRWATYVADAEAGISREHTRWLARRRAKLAHAGMSG